MYKVIGADGKEYGPASAEQIRQWIAEGRVNAQTKAQAAGTTDWRTLAEFGEFAEALKAATPPKHPPTGKVPGRTNSMAVAAVVLGILGFATFGLVAILTGPIGLVLGLVAINKIKKSQGQLGGYGLALAGVIISAASLVMAIVFGGVVAAMLVPALKEARAKAQGIACVNNVKQLGLAVRIWASDNNNRFPSATNWCDAVLTCAGTDKVFKCPAAAPVKRCHYAFNAKLSGLEVAEVSPETVMIFESDGGWNASGGPELAPAKPRHPKGFVVAFADGSVRQVSPTEFNRLRWAPKDNLP